MLSSLLLFFRHGPVIFVNFLKITIDSQSEYCTRSFSTLVAWMPNTCVTQPSTRPSASKEHRQSCRTLLLPSFRFQLTHMFTKINYALVFVWLPTAMEPRTTVSHPIVAKQGHKHNLFPVFSRRVGKLSSIQPSVMVPCALYPICLETLGWSNPTAIPHTTSLPSQSWQTFIFHLSFLPSLPSSLVSPLLLVS